MGITTPLPTLEMSTTTPPFFSTPRPASVVPGTAQTPWYLPVHPTSHLRLLLVQLSAIYLIQVRYYSIFTLILDPPHVPLFVAATAAPSTSPGLTFTIDLDATPQNDGSPPTGLRDAKDRLHPPSVSHTMCTNTTNTLVPQSSRIVHRRDLLLGVREETILTKILTFRVVRMTSFSLRSNFSDVRSYILVGFLVSPEDTD